MGSLQTVLPAVLRSATLSNRMDSGDHVEVQGCRHLCDIIVIVLGLCRDLATFSLSSTSVRAVLQSLDAQFMQSVLSLKGTEGDRAFSEPLLTNTTMDILRYHSDTIQSLIHGSIKSLENKRAQDLHPILASLANALVVRVKLVLDNIAIAFTLNFQHHFWSTPWATNHQGQQVSFFAALHNIAGQVSERPKIRILYTDFYGSRAQILERLLQVRRPLKGLRIAEVGVSAGNTTAYLLERAAALGIVEYTAVDPYPNGSIAYEEAKRRLQPWLGSVAKLVRKPSVEAAFDVGLASLDLVFIDGHHGWKHVLNDVDYWLPRIRFASGPEGGTGGVLAGHDFHISHPQVIWAALLACQCADRENVVHVGYDSTWWCERSK